jgi:hypothetical protein
MLPILSFAFMTSYMHIIMESIDLSYGTQPEIVIVVNMKPDISDGE